jgi:hypothetical protein
VARRKAKATRSPLDVAFEKLLKTAQKRVDKFGQTLEKQLRRKVDRFAKAAESTIDRAAKKSAEAAAQQIQSALRAALRNIDEVSRQLDLSGQQGNQLRRGLETATGAVSGFKAVAPWAAIVPDHRLRAMLYTAGAMIGAAQGAAQEEIRKEIAKAVAEIEREKVDIRHLLASVDRDVERARAARRRTGVVG